MKSIYVGNLNPKTTEFDLLDEFTKYGNVTSALIIREKDGASKGFAFIEMSDDSQADKAIRELNNFELAGNKIGVKEARPQSESN